MEITIQEAYEMQFANECSCWLEESIKEYAKENTLNQIICATVDKMAKTKIELLKETYDYKYDLLNKKVDSLNKTNAILNDTNIYLQQENNKLQNTIAELNKNIISQSSYKDIEDLNEKIKKLEQ